MGIKTLQFIKKRIEEIIQKGGEKNISPLFY